MAMAKAKFVATPGAGEVAEVSSSSSCGSILMNASRAADIFYYVAHID
jgi:hypothetical protein